MREGKQLRTLRQVRTDLVAQLRTRVPEFEAAVLARVSALADAAGSDDPDYAIGLGIAVSELIEYGLMGIQYGDEWDGPVPPGAIAQARRAARNGVSLDAVLRRYAAGDRLLGGFILDESDRFSAAALRQVIRANGPHVDRLMETVSAEYADEKRRVSRSSDQRMSERVLRLLGEDDSVDLDMVDYEFGVQHLGMIATGNGGAAVVRRLSRALGCRALVVPRGGDVAWAWLGRVSPIPAGEFAQALAALDVGEVRLAIGEPHPGIHGWRLTHREARAALEVMLRGSETTTRSGDVVLLAAVLQDDALAESLRETYLAPLDRYGDAGLELRRTMRAYLDAGLNAATAAAALEVDRHTVQRRLRKVEKALGRLLPACHAELEIALRLEELGEAEAGQAPVPASSDHAGEAVGHHGKDQSRLRTTLAHNQARLR